MTATRTAACRLPVLLAAAVAWLFAGAAPVHAAPALTADVQVDAQTLLGSGQTTIKVAAENTGSTDANHVSYRVLLRPGMAYVTGSSNAGAPTLTLANQPSSGFTTLIWRSAADLPAGKRNTLQLQASHTASALINYNTALQIQAGAYASDSPGVLPEFDPATGQPQPAAAAATGAATTQMTPLQVSITSDSPDGKVLRGVHDRQTIYTVTIRNTSAAATNSVGLHYYLPPGLEYFRCAATITDNTTDAPTNPGSPREYPGAGPITAAGAVPAGCRSEAAVETVQLTGHPTVPDGLYTHVTVSSIGNIAAGAQITAQFRAAVPMRENTLDWDNDGVDDPVTTTPPDPPSIVPAITSPFKQATNLDNNSGPLTAHGDTLVPYAAVSGFYQGTTPNPMVNRAASIAQTVSDLRVTKTANASTLTPGTETLWTLKAETSEYRPAAGLELSDSLPDGLCPIQAGTNLDSSDPGAECATPAGGPSPSHSYTWTEEIDGRWTLNWTGLPALAGADSLTITYPSRTRSQYQENSADDAPVRAGDRVTNSVVAADDPLGGGPSDTSSVTLTAALPTLDTKVGTQRTVTDCTDSAVNYADATTTATAPVFGYGDRVCWRVDGTFPEGVTTAATGDVVGVFPPTATLDTGFGSGAGEQAIGGVDTSGATFDPGAPLSGGGTLTRWSFAPTQTGATRFARHVATRVLPPAAGTASGLQEQMTRIASEGTSGERSVSRDTAGYVVRAPALSLISRITKHNATNHATPQTTATVKGLDEVTYRLAATNTGDAAATGTELWSRLPAGHTCADVTVADGGSCAAGVVQWTVASIAAAGNAQVSFTLTLRTAIQPSESLTVASGVREFRSPTNTGGFFRYIPASNIDPAHEATLPQPDAMGVAAASASTDITVAAPSVAITRTTSVSQIGGDEDNNATIAEQITYTVTLTLPRGTTIRDGVLSGELLGAQPYVPGTIAWAAGPAAAQGTLDDTTAPLTAALTPVYTTPADDYETADTTVSFTFRSFLDDQPSNVRGQQVQARGALTYTPAAGGTTTIGPQTVLTRISEPRAQLQVTATAHRVDNEGENEVVTAVAAGDLVTYEVRLGAANGTATEPTTPLYDSTLTDTIPAGLTPVGTDGQPLTAAGATEAGGMWDPGTRTITFSPDAVIQIGTPQVLTYRVRVNEYPYGRQTFTNNVVATTTSMAGTVPGERVSTGPGNGYHAALGQTVTAQAATVQHAASDDRMRATIGELVSYTTTITLPPNVAYYDVTAETELPPYLEFESHDAAATKCSSPDPCVGIGEVRPYGKAARAAGREVLAWDIGDVAADASLRTVTIKYAVRVRATRRVIGGTVTAGKFEKTLSRIGSNNTDKTPPFDPGNPGPIPAIPTAFDDTSSSGQFQLTLIEPNVQVRKYVRRQGETPVRDWQSTNDDVRPGDTVEFRVEVAAGGNATTATPLYDVVVTDAVSESVAGFASELVDVAAGTLPPGVTLTDGWTAADPAMTWHIAGPIAPGSSVNLTYTAKLRPVAELDDGMLVGGRAQITEAWNLAAADRHADAATPGDQNFRKIYTAGPASGAARVDTPTPTIRKYVGATGVAATGFATLRQEVTFRVVLSNASYTAQARGAEIVDQLPPGWEYVSGAILTIVDPGPPATTSPSMVVEPTILPGTATPAVGDLLTWRNFGDIPAGGTATVTYKARPLPAAIPADLSPGPQVNSVSATVRDKYNNSGDLRNDITDDGTGAYRAAGTPATSRNADATVTMRLAKLGAAASATDANVYAGASGQFLIEATNTAGQAPAEGVTVKTVLPAGVTYAADSAVATPAAGFTETAFNPATREVTWKLLSVAQSGSTTITVPVVLDDDLPDATALTQNVTVSDELGSHTASSTITALARADLEAGLTAPTTVVAGKQITFDATLESSGPSRAAGSKLTAVVPAGTAYVGATPTGSGATCAEASGTITCDYGGLRTGDTRTAAITVRVLPGTTGTVGMTVTAGATTADQVPANNAAVVTAAVTTASDLSVTLTDNAEPGRVVIRDQPVALTFTVANAGPSDAAGGVELTGTFPSQLAAHGTLPSECEYDDAPTNTEFTCIPGRGTPQAGQLAAGASATFVISRLGDTEGHGLTVTAAVASAIVTDPASGNNSVSEDYIVGPSVDLQAGLTADTNVDANGVITYTASVRNDKHDRAHGVVITVPLPAGTEWHSSSQCTVASGVVTCAVGELAVGDSASREFKLRAPFALGSSTVTATAAVRGNEGDPVKTNNTAKANTVVGAASNLIVEPGAPPTAVAGGEVTWTVTVRNLGPSVAHQVKLALDLPGGVPFRSATSTQGSCGVENSVVNCDIGTMGVDPTPRRAGAPQGRSTVGRVVITVKAIVPASFGGSTITVGMRADAKEVDPEPSSRITAGTTVMTVAPPIDPGAPGGGGGGGGGGTPPGSPGGEQAVPQTTLALTVVSPKPKKAKAKAKSKSKSKKKAKQESTAIKVRGGARLAVTLRAKNTGKHTAHNARVCTTLPGQLTYRSTKGGKVEDGELCFTVRALAPGKTRTVQVKVRVNPRSKRGKASMTSYAVADNAPRRSRSVAFQITTTGKLRPEVVRGFTG